jgi:tetratricopeptide (TPR) repeat protein
MEAQQILERALSKTEKICGRTHLGTLDTLLLLAWVYHKTNQLDEAERIYRRCLEGAERRLGQAQFDTLRVVRIVARFYFEQARYGESTALYERALAGEREQRCPNDVRALKLTHNLGVIFHPKPVWRS